MKVCQQIIPCPQIFDEVMKFKLPYTLRYLIEDMSPSPQTVKAGQDGLGVGKLAVWGAHII